ncbi:hypothetical protein KIN20_013514 [Parelaphostrongylus tenuis]|uniref:G-protein coupled receptors family 1 profile domain-containing protein n=1 Tax=Parelaphostrongylus tenuis TaxID=148309 RepID=A0AAD5MC79_PARTN|nr:hypothetical protein KIN20_013514 [Parelaphostrongylus tenuis]
MVSLYGHVIYSLSTAVVNDNPVEQRQSFQQTDLPSCSPSMFPEWLLDGVVHASSINNLNLKDKQHSHSLYSEKLCVKNSSRSNSLISLLRLSKADIDPTTLLRSTNQEKILVAKKKVTRMLMTIVVAFVVCWLPNFLWWLLVRASDYARNDIVQNSRKTPTKVAAVDTANSVPLIKLLPNDNDEVSGGCGGGVRDDGDDDVGDFL